MLNDYTYYKQNKIKNFKMRQNYIMRTLRHKIVCLCIYLYLTMLLLFIFISKIYDCLSNTVLSLSLSLSNLNSKILFIKRKVKKKKNQISYIVICNCYIRYNPVNKLTQLKHQEILLFANTKM